MEEPCRVQETTLNNNIAKELIWKRNAPYFYQNLYTQELEWPSLSVEWWVNQDSQLTNKSKSDSVQQLCYLTYCNQTNGADKNYLVMAKVYLPKVYLPNQQYTKRKSQRPIKASDAIKKNDNIMLDKILVMFQVEHDGDVHQIKHNPKKTNLIATRAQSGQINIFDKTQFKGRKNVVPPVTILTGHESDGYAMQWNPQKQGFIVAGSYDSKLTLWDIKSSQQKNNKISPLCYFNFHTKQIEDVSHNQFHDCIFASCDDSGQVVLWDTRNSVQPIHFFKADHSPLYSVQFSPHKKNLFATGGSEKMIKLWDIRNMSQPLTSLSDLGNQQIKQLKWSVQQSECLWVAAGNNITMWDLNEQRAKFVHSGHMQNINQMDLHPGLPNTVASVDQNNDIHVFQPTQNAFL